MECFEKIPAVSQCTENNSVYAVKQEPGDENIVDQLETQIEIREERPIIPEIVHNHAIVADIKQENTEDFSTSSRQNFVFVACAENIVLNEAKFDNDNINSNNETNFNNTSARVPVKRPEPCPYCKKKYVRLIAHKNGCEWKFVYSCTFCPAILLRRGNIKRHLSMKHPLQLKGTSIDKVTEEIIAKRIELNFTTPEEKHKLILQMMNEKNDAHMRANINVTNDQRELIIPDTINTLPEPTVTIPAEISTPNAPTIIFIQNFDVPTVVEKENSSVSNQAEKQILNVPIQSANKELNVLTQSANKDLNVPTQSANKELTVAGSSTSQESIVPFVVIHQKIHLPNEINMHNQSVTAKKLKAKLYKQFHCNECVYKTHSKAILSAHIMMNHSVKLNLRSYKCFQCEKHFPDAVQLKAHKANCNMKIFYPCMFCKKILIVKEIMLKHILQKHAEKITDKKSDEIAHLVEAKKMIVDISTVKKRMENSSNCSAAKKQKLNEPAENTELVVVDSNTNEKSNVHSVVIDKKRNSIANNKENRSVITKKTEANNRSDQLNLRLHKCRKCEKTFQYQDHLKAHQTTSCIKFIHCCPFCSKITILKDNILRHVRQKHIKEVENKTIDEIADLVETRKKIVNFGTVNNQVQKSSVRSTTKKQKLHIEGTAKELLVVDSNTNEKSCNSHSSIFYKCCKCEKSFRYQEQLNGHKATCNIKFHHPCPFCTKMFLRKKYTEKHVLEKHPQETENKKPDEIMELIEANKKAVDPSNLDNIAENAKSKPQSKIEYLSCDHCSFRSIKKDLLVRHIMKNHSAELNLKVGCTKRRVTCLRCNTVLKECNLEAHGYACRKKFHYACTFCPKVYTSEDWVESHIVQQHSSELSNKPIDEIIEEIYSNRTKIKGPTVIDPNDVDASTLDYVIVYCSKCKSLKTIRNKARNHKNICRDCGARNVYLCSKCKLMNSLEYPLLKRHWTQCNEYNQVSQNHLDKIVVYTCSECQYTCIHKYKFDMHLARSKHKVAKDTDAKNVKDDKNEQITDDLVMYDEDKFTVRPCVIDFATMTHRYCPKCDKIVTKEMQERKPVAEGICQVCQTRFVAQCVQCNVRRDKWLNMRYHLSTKCFPGDYLCIKCLHRTCNWQLMQKHYVLNHTNRRVPYLCEFCSFKSTHRTNFYTHLKNMHPDKTEHIVFDNYYTVKRQDIDYACDKCSFTSKHKYSIKIHLQTIHGKKKHKCKLCKFKTRYIASLRRHVTTRHPNLY